MWICMQSRLSDTPPFAALQQMLQGVFLGIITFHMSHHTHYEISHLASFGATRLFIGAIIR